jgi:hypothetical protein
MAEVKIYSKLIRGEGEHVHSSTRDDAPCVLFVPRTEVDGHVIRTEHPDVAAWRKAGFPEDSAPENPWPQPELGVGEGFMVLSIDHADDETWKYLSTLPDDAYGEGSTRESFQVLVTHLEYIPLEPGDDAPWHSPDKAPPLRIADLARPST